MRSGVRNSCRSTAVNCLLGGWAGGSGGEMTSAGGCPIGGGGGPTPTSRCGPVGGPRAAIMSAQSAFVEPLCYPMRRYPWHSGQKNALSWAASSHLQCTFAFSLACPWLRKLSLVSNLQLSHCTGPRV